MTGRGEAMVAGAQRSGPANPRRERLAAATVYVAGAILYALAREAGGLDFTASPLFYGLILLVASYFRPRLLASALLLCIWGTVVLLDGKGPFPAGRTAPLFVS